METEQVKDEGFDGVGFGDGEKGFVEVLSVDVNVLEQRVGIGRWCDEIGEIVEGDGRNGGCAVGNGGGVEAWGYGEEDVNGQRWFVSEYVFAQLYKGDYVAYKSCWVDNQCLFHVRNTWEL